MKNLTFNDMLLGMQPRMLNFAFILTSDRNDAYTLLQQSTLKALDNAGEFEGDADSFRNWVYDIMRSEVVGMKLKQRRPRRVMLVTGDDIPADCHTPDRLDQAIARITGQSRQVIEMHLKGYRDTEISTITGISRHLVRSHLSSCLSHMLVILRN